MAQFIVCLRSKPARLGFFDNFKCFLKTTTEQLLRLKSSSLLEIKSCLACKEFLRMVNSFWLDCKSGFKKQKPNQSKLYGSLKIAGLSGIKFELPRTYFERTFYLQIQCASGQFRINLVIFSPGEFYRCK